VNPGSKKVLLWAVLAVLALAAFGMWWRFFRPKADEGSFVQGNGRIEATEIDVSAKGSGRVEDILVNEGDFVLQGDMVARMDTETVAAQLNQALAEVANAKSAKSTALATVAQREADVATAKAQLVQSQAELEVAKKTNARIQTLYKRGVASAQDADDNAARVRSAGATVTVARAKITASEAAVDAARAQVEQADAGIAAMEAVAARLKTELEEGILRAPRNGRVQYRIVQPGEVVGAGGKVLNVVDLNDVYMTFFLPETVAGRVALNSEVRIILDAAPNYVIPARVSFVASVAQFTPKTVETASERQKLMFRVKARIDEDLLKKHLKQVKTGLPGVAWLKLDPQAEWPASMALQVSP